MSEIYSGDARKPMEARTAVTSSIDMNPSRSLSNTANTAFNSATSSIIYVINVNIFVQSQIYTADNRKCAVYKSWLRKVFRSLWILRTEHDESQRLSSNEFQTVRAATVRPNIEIQWCSMNSGWWLFCRLWWMHAVHWHCLRSECSIPSCSAADIGEQLHKSLYCIRWGTSDQRSRCNRPLPYL